MKKLLLLALVCLAQFGHAATKLNVIYILADDLGYADLSVYGQTHFNTPNIHALAKNRIRFSLPPCAPPRWPGTAAETNWQHHPTD